MSSFANSCEKFVISFAIWVILYDSILSTTSPITMVISCSVCVSIRKFSNFLHNLVSSLAFVYNITKNSLCTLHLRLIMMNDLSTECTSSKSKVSECKLTLQLGKVHFNSFFLVNTASPDVLKSRLEVANELYFGGMWHVLG